MNRTKSAAFWTGPTPGMPRAVRRGTAAVPPRCGRTFIEVDRMKRLLLAVACLAALAFPVNAFAQGVQTGIITGSVQSSDGLTLPGVTVTVTSPSLQGQRTAVTDVNGVYILRGLPAGTYTVTFDMPSFKSVTKQNITVNVGGTSDVSQTMALANVTETVNVTAEPPKPAPLSAPTISQAYGKAEVDALPVGRNPNQVAELAPGLTGNSPNAGQVNISGATAFDNVFMINGVDIN